MVLNVHRYDYPMEAADWLKFDLLSNLAADIKVTAKFHGPDGYILKDGFGFDMNPGQLEPGIVLVPKGRQWERVELSAYRFAFGEKDQPLRCQGCQMYHRDDLPSRKPLTFRKTARGKTEHKLKKCRIAISN